MRAVFRLAPLGPLVLALAAFALRVYALGRQSFWYDEGFSAFLASLPLREVLQYRSMDPHPPLHPWSLHLWRALAGDSETALRFPSAVAGALAVVLIYRLGADLLGRRAGLMAGLVAAVNPYLVYYAQETRSYSYLLGFSLLATVLLLRQLRRPDDRPLAWLPYVAALAAALWSHYFALFIVPVHWAIAALLWQWGRRPPWVWAAVQAAAGALFAPWLLVSMGVLTGYRTVGRGEPPDEMLRQTVTALVHGAAHDLRLFTPAAGFVGGLIAAGLLAALLLRPKPRRWQAPVALLLGAGVPFAGLAVLTLTRPTFHPRYLIVAVPFALVLAVAPAALLGARLRLAGWALAGLLAAVMLPFLNAYYHNPAAYRADYRTAAAFLNAHVRPDDAVIYNAWYTRFILDYYSREPYSRYTPFRSGPLTEEQTVEELNRIAPGHPRLWLVLWQDDAADPGRQLTSVVRRTGTLVAEQWLGDLRIFGYALPAGETPFRAEGIPHRMQTRFGDAIELAGYRLETPQVEAGQHARIALFWRARAPLTESLTGFVHLVTMEPYVHAVAQQDKAAGGDYRPSTAWQPGETITDEYFFPVPADTPPGDYLVEVGLYRTADMQRVPADGDGAWPELLSALLPQRITVLPR